MELRLCGAQPEQAEQKEEEKMLKGSRFLRQRQQ